MLWGTEPLEFSLSYDDVEEIFAYEYNTDYAVWGYDDYFYFKKKNDDTTYYFDINDYYRRAAVYQTSKEIARNIEVLIDKDSSGRINTPTDFDTT